MRWKADHGSIAMSCCLAQMMACLIEEGDDVSPHLLDSILSGLLDDKPCAARCVLAVPRNAQQSCASHTNAPSSWTAGGAIAAAHVDATPWYNSSAQKLLGAQRDYAATVKSFGTKVPLDR